MTSVAIQNPVQINDNDTNEINLAIIKDDNEVDFDSKKAYLTEFIASDNARIIVEGNIILHQIDTINLQKIFIELFNALFDIHNSYDKEYIPFIIARKLYVNINNLNTKYSENSISKISTISKSLIERIPDISAKFGIDYSSSIENFNNISVLRFATEEIQITFDINCVGFAEYIRKLFDQNFIEIMDSNTYSNVITAFYNFFMELNNFIITVPEQSKSNTIQNKSMIQNSQSCIGNTNTSSVQSKSPIKNQCHGLSKSTKKQCQKPSSKDCFTIDGKSSCKVHAGSASASDEIGGETGNGNVHVHVHGHGGGVDNVSVSNSSMTSSSITKSPKNQCHGLKKNGTPCGVSANKSGNFMTQPFEGKCYPTCHNHGGSAVNMLLINKQTTNISNETNVHTNQMNISNDNHTPTIPNQIPKQITNSKSCHGITGKKVQCSKSATTGNLTEDGYPACYQHNGKKSCM